MKRSDHVGIVVENLDTARALLEGEFGLELAREIDNDDLRAVFLRCDNAAIELIQMKDAVPNREQLAGPGAARVEHIALKEGGS